MLALLSSDSVEGISISGPSAASRAQTEPQVNPAFEGSALSVFAPREDIFLEGDDADYGFEVEDGIVCAYRILPDGARHVLSFYFPGDLIGYCSLDTYAFSAEALTHASVRRIPRSSIERMIERRPDFARKLLKLSVLELAVTRDHLMCMASKSADGKVAAFLLALSRRNEVMGKDPLRLEIPMTRVDIGDYLGLTIETVSRTLSKLRRNGIIDLPRSSLIVLKSRQLLRNVERDE